MTHVALAAVMVSGTALVGWWAVPALGLAYGVWRGSRATPLAASGAAAVGWGALMAFNWVVGPTGALSELLGSVLPRVGPTSGDSGISSTAGRDIGRGGLSRTV